MYDELHKHSVLIALLEAGVSVLHRCAYPEPALQRGQTSNFHEEEADHTFTLMVNELTGRMRSNRSRPILDVAHSAGGSVPSGCASGASSNDATRWSNRTIMKLASA